MHPAASQAISFLHEWEEHRSSLVSAGGGAEPCITIFVVSLKCLNSLRTLHGFLGLPHLVSFGGHFSHFIPATRATCREPFCCPFTSPGVHVASFPLTVGVSLILVSTVAKKAGVHAPRRVNCCDAFGWCTLRLAANPPRGKLSTAKVTESAVMTVRLKNPLARNKHYSVSDGGRLTCSRAKNELVRACCTKCESCVTIVL